MDRYEMLDNFEQYWLKVQAMDPDEKMDIPAAMMYYRSLDDEQLAEEYSFKFR